LRVGLLHRSTRGEIATSAFFSKQARRPMLSRPRFRARYWPFKKLFDDGAMVHEKRDLSWPHGVLLAGMLGGFFASGNHSLIYINAIFRHSKV